MADAALFEQLGVSPEPFWLLPAGVPPEELQELGERLLEQRILEVHREGQRVVDLPIEPEYSEYPAIDVDSVDPFDLSTFRDWDTSRSLLRSAPRGRHASAFTGAGTNAVPGRAEITEADTVTRATAYLQQRYEGRRTDMGRPVAGALGVVAAISLASIADPGLLGMHFESGRQRTVDCVDAVARMDFAASAPLAWIAKNNNGEQVLVQPTKDGKQRTLSMVTNGGVDIVACPIDSTNPVSVRGRTVRVDLSKIALRPHFDPKVQSIESVDFEASTEVPQTEIARLNEAANDPVVMAGEQRDLRVKALQAMPEQCASDVTADAIDGIIANVQDDYPHMNIEVSGTVDGDLSGNFAKSLAKGARGIKSIGLRAPRMQACESTEEDDDED